MDDWKYDAYKSYLEYNLSDKIEVSKMIASHICNGNFLLLFSKLLTILFFIISMQ